jgi:hypothetical protein
MYICGTNIIKLKTRIEEKIFFICQEVFRADRYLLKTKTSPAVYISFSICFEFIMDVAAVGFYGQIAKVDFCCNLM